MKDRAMRSLLIAFAISSFAGAAAAQTVYKFATPEGGTGYTNDPKAAPRGAQRVELPPSAVSPVPPPAPPRRLSAQERRLAAQADGRAAGLDRAAEDIASATLDLRAAEERRLNGQEPLEGERQGRRFRPEYWERQHAIDADIRAAQARLDEAVARRNALK